MQEKVVSLAKILDYEHKFVDGTVQEFKANTQKLAIKQGMVHDLLFGQAAKVHKFRHVHAHAHQPSMLLSYEQVNQFFCCEVFRVLTFRICAGNITSRCHVRSIDDGPFRSIRSMPGQPQIDLCSWH